MSLCIERPCRVCGGTLETILDLGTLHPSDFLQHDAEPLQKVPHDLCACENCKLVQLRHTLEPDLMFRQYWYLSGVNEVMREELTDIVDSLKARVELTDGDIVIDIGANDGTLLSAYVDAVLTIAFEPAHNLQVALRRKADLVIADYFPQGVSELRGDFNQSVKVITAIATFYATDDPLGYLSVVKELLHPDGVFVVQFQDWHQMQRSAAFDNICTEHLFYPTLAAIERMAKLVGLKVVDAETRKINGGSLRLYLKHDDPTHTVATMVSFLRQAEALSETWDAFRVFSWRCREVKRQIQAVLEATPGPIDVYGASTKFNTLAQWCDINHTVVRQAWERSPAKFGLMTSGTKIPIVNEVDGRLDPPQALLCGIWQFRAAVLQREESYLNLGGTIIFPLPHVDVVRGGHD